MNEEYQCKNRMKNLFNQQIMKQIKYFKIKNQVTFFIYLKQINKTYNYFFKEDQLQISKIAYPPLYFINYTKQFSFDNNQILAQIKYIKFVHSMTNQQKIRLIDCFFQPNSAFALYDYTKIIYPIDGYICMRQISSSDSQPSFIKLQHQYEKIHSLLTYHNLIVSLQENFNHQFMVGFYDSVHFHTKLGSSLAQQFKKVLNYSPNQHLRNKKLEFKVKYSSDNIFILFSLKNVQNSIQSKQLSKVGSKDTINLSGQQSNDNELIVVNVKSKRVVSRNYFSGNVKQMYIKSNDIFSILHGDSTLIEYQLLQNLSAKQVYESLYMMKKRQLQFIHPNPSSKHKHQISSHIWLKEQLIVLNGSLQQIVVYVQNKKSQTISLQNIKNVKILWPIMCGFLICNQNFMYLYKKLQLSYVCIAQFFIREVGFSPQLILSPQQDILAYFMNSKNSIQYINKFNQEVQLQANSNKKHTKQLKGSGSIQFKKDLSLRIDVNKKNNTFALSHQSTIQLYSINNFQQYLEESIQSEQVNSNSPVSKGRLKRMNTLGSMNGLLQNMTKQQTILRVAIHPYIQLLAVSLKSKVRIYQILFNQLSHVKDIYVTNCSEMFYSNSGQFLSIVVSGKNGSKCYVYKANQDYELMQCLSIGKKIEKFVWSKYDNFLYGAHCNGYYRWSIQNGLKQRFQTLFDIPFNVIDAVLNDKNDVVVLYGDNHIIEVNQKMDKQNELNIKDIIKVSTKINQIVYQNGSYFLNMNSQVIMKCQQLSTIDSVIKQCISSHLSQSKHQTIYRQASGQCHNYQMIVCSGELKRNIIFLIEEQSKNIKVLQWGKNSNSQAKVTKNSQLIKIDRKQLRRIFKKYTKYQDEIKALEENMHQTIQKLKQDLIIKEKQRQKSFLKQIKSNQQKYEQIKTQKQKLQHTIQQKIQKHEEQTIKQIKQLQKIYERKIAITTNKLLTSQQINYRNMLLAEQNLKKLQREANHDVQKIRQEYKKHLAQYMNEKDSLAQQVYRVKKQYQSRLYDLQMQNEKILQEHQSKSEDSIQLLKRKLVNEQIKCSEAISKKDNFEKDLQKELISNEILNEKIKYLQSKCRQGNKKSQYLLIDIQKYEKILQQKNTSIAIYEQRINDLQKSNQILKYRVIQLKGETQPQSQQNQKLKQNLNQLQLQYDKIVKSAFQKQQMLSIYKKQSQKNKQIVQKLQSKIKKIQKSYLELLDKVLNITKAPIQQIRKQLIHLLNSNKQDQKYLNRPTSSYARSQSPLGQLNRIRQHLQSCLHQAVDSNKKNQQQKKVQLLKKNRQNSQLIKQINDLRRKVRDLQAIIKEKDLQFNKLYRGQPIVINDLKNYNQKQNTRLQFFPKNQDQNQTEQLSLNYQSNNEKQTRSQTRKQTRQTKQSFFDKSLFKSSSHWRQKRLKTQHSQHRQAQSRSIKRNTSGKFLQIDNGGHYEDVQDLKRVIQQKETIIKQLINKIQSLS